MQRVCVLVVVVGPQVEQVLLTVGLHHGRIALRGGRAGRARGAGPGLGGARVRALIPVDVPDVSGDVSIEDVLLVGGDEGRWVPRRRRTGRMATGSACPLLGREAAIDARIVEDLSLIHI